jgi:hypothetical protein
LYLERIYWQGWWFLCRRRSKLLKHWAEHHGVGVTWGKHSEEGSGRSPPRQLLPWTSSRGQGEGRSVKGLVAALLDPEILPRAADLGWKSPSRRCAGDGTGNRASRGSRVPCPRGLLTFHFFNQVPSYEGCQGPSCQLPYLGTTYT